MAVRIKYRAKCYQCGQWFEKGQAWLHRVAGAWRCHCDACYKTKQAKEEESQ